MLASPPVSRADAVTDWNLIASNAIVVTAGQPPPVSVLHFAIVHGVVYDAVNAIDRGHRPYLVQPNANPTDSKKRPRQPRRSVCSWESSRGSWGRYSLSTTRT